MEEKTISSQLIYDGKVVKLYKDQVLLSNGQTSIREEIKHSGGASVLVVKNQKILFVKQFRYAYLEEVLEIPAGKLNAGENPKETAIRELEEECGLVAKNLKLLYEVYPTPGYTNERLYVYLASEVTEGKIHLDDDEFVEPIWIEESKVKQMLLNGEIKDAKTIIALQRYFLEQ